MFSCAADYEPAFALDWAKRLCAKLYVLHCVVKKNSKVFVFHFSHDQADEKCLGT